MMERFGKGLDNPVIGYGYRFHSPFPCTVDYIRNIGHSVHITHLRMAVKLHTLYRFVVHSFGSEVTGFLDAVYVPEGEYSVIFIDAGGAFYQHELSVAYIIKKPLLLILSGKQFYIYRIGKVSHGKRNHLLAGSRIPDFKRTYLTANNDRPDITVYIAYIHGTFGKILAEDNIRIGGLFSLTEFSSCRFPFNLFGFTRRRCTLLSIGRDVLFCLRYCHRPAGVYIIDIIIVCHLFIHQEFFIRCSLGYRRTIICL